MTASNQYEKIKAVVDGLYPEQARVPTVNTTDAWVLVPGSVLNTVGAGVFSATVHAQHPTNALSWRIVGRNEGAPGEFSSWVVYANGDDVAGAGLTNDIALAWTITKTGEVGVEIKSTVPGAHADCELNMQKW